MCSSGLPFSMACLTRKLPAGPAFRSALSNPAFASHSRVCAAVCSSAAFSRRRERKDSLSLGPSMKALLCKAFGPPDSLLVEDLPDPVAGKGEVAVDVFAIGLNFLDTLIIE